eukprot:7380524-Prymnesium_polylepis.2
MLAPHVPAAAVALRSLSAFEACALAFSELVELPLALCFQLHRVLSARVLTCQHFSLTLLLLASGGIAQRLGIQRPRQH